MKKTNTTTLRTTTSKVWGVLAGLLLAASPAWAETSYSYARVLEGPSTLFLGGGERESLEPHQPVLVGDRVWVPHGSRLEVVLSDGSLLRLQGDSEVLFEEIAYSADTDGRRTALQLLAGEVQWVVPAGAAAGEVPVLATPGATIYVQEAGTYRVTVGRDGWTELVVREGMAELVNERSSLRVYSGEAVWAAAEGPRFEVRYADDRDGLERWGDRLTREAALAAVPYVEEPLRYASAPLADHGVWVEHGGQRAWRPRVEVAWRPYSRGYWRHTPVGWNWVSHDPWGWVTHHYGSWDYVGSHGWIWYPAAAWAPARVVWYWGPSYVGWCPTGYYSHHYRRHHRRHGGHGFGLSFGIYGWAGGGWGHYGHWSFTASGHFGHRRHHREVHSGRHMARRHAALDRGIITTDPGSRRRPAREVYTALEARADTMSRKTGRPMPDVTELVARKPLRDEVVRAVSRPWPADEDRKGLAAPRADSKPRVEPRTADKPRVEPWVGHRPRAEPRADRKPGVEPRTADKPRIEPWAGRQPRAEPRADRKPRVEPRTSAKPRVEPWTGRQPRADRKPQVTPRATPRATPRVDRHPRVAPRADRKPQVTPRATPRVDRHPRVAPRADRKPQVTPRAAPRVDRHPRVAPRADRKPQAAPRAAPRVDRRPRVVPRADRKPQAAPRAAPRVDRHPRVAPRADRKPAPPRSPVRAAPAPRREVSKSPPPSPRRSPVRAQAPERSKGGEAKKPAKSQSRKPKDD